MLSVLYIVLGISLFCLGIGIGGIIENRRLRKDIIDVVDAMANGLAAVQGSMKVISRIVQDLDNEVAKLTETQDIPVVDDYSYKSHRTMELINYDPEDYED